MRSAVNVFVGQWTPLAATVSWNPDQKHFGEASLAMVQRYSFSLEVYTAGPKLKPCKATVIIVSRAKPGDSKSPSRLPIHLLNLPMGPCRRLFCCSLSQLLQ